jgi:hypothetical protein
MTTKICPKCGQTWFLNAMNFCTYDGEKLLEAKICECGEEILSSWQFCDKCGKPVNQEGK